jgi:hypothetical protein
MKSQGLKSQDLKIQDLKIQDLKSQGLKIQGLKIQGLKIQGLKIQGLPAPAQPTRCSRVNAPCPADRAMLDEATPTRAAWMPTPHQALHQVSTATLLR